MTVPQMIDFFAEPRLNLLLWVSCLIYLAPLRHREHYGLRVAGALLLAGTCSLLASLTPLLSAGWGEMVADYGLVVLLFWFCGSMGLPTAVYCGVWALISRQMTTEIILILSGLPLLTPLFVGGLRVLTILGIYAVCYCAMGCTIARWMPENGQYRVGPRQISSALVLLGIFELLVYLFTGSKGFFEDKLQVLTVMLAQCYCVTMLYMQNALFKKSAMKQELATLNRLWYQQKQQYAVSKENIATINRKCHDLKHQVAAMRTIAVAEDREKYLSEIENSVNIYDAMVQTGNEVLDTVLTEKSLYCEANQIKISCIADGGQLGFMDPIDLYAIFGNALDNAIESVQQLQDMDKRQIDVLIRAQQQFLAIHIMNPLRQALTFDEDHLPLSTKASDGYHGFGLKSIRHSVKKYGGFVSVSEEDGCFALRILVPLPKSD